MKSMEMSIVFKVFVVLSYNFAIVASSEGDRSPFYENCVRNCVKKNCSEDGTSFTERAAYKQDQWARLLHWDCKEECRYHCMWHTVSAYEERNFRVPKFHGKWPFERLYGVQEPAAALASVLNLAMHAFMYVQLVRDKRFSLNTTPLLYFWHFFFFVCAHAWLWSAVFHARDTAFTEFMDYACALSLVMLHFVAAVLRLLYHKRKVAGVILIFTLVYFLEHVRYLYTGDVDYEYNMTVNIICGMVAIALWMLFSLGALCAGGAKGHAERRYVWRLVVYCKLSGAAVLLELFDFPPYMRAWDAHALWHLSTAPLPLLFYRFIIDDLDYLQTLKQTERKTEYKIA